MFIIKMKMSMKIPMEIETKSINENTNEKKDCFYPKSTIGFFSFSFLLVFSLILFLSSCNRYIHTHRNHFVQQGADIPTPDVSHYKSPQLRVGQDADMGIAIAISGGGARAANFGMGILMALEELGVGQRSNILNEIDYFSSVSGGGFAAGAYINALHFHRYTQDTASFSLRRAYYQGGIREDLSRSYLTPVIAGWLASPRAWVTHIDEGDALEKSIDNHVLGYLNRRQHNLNLKLKDRSEMSSLTLGSVFVSREDERPVLYPMFVANATNYHSMAIVPFTPDIMECYQISGYSHRRKRYHDDEIDDPYDIPLAIGLKASGSFPVAISNTTLESAYDDKKCFLHLTDGGIADNIGYKTALELLETDFVPKDKIMFIVDADNWGTRPTFSHKEAAASSIKMATKLTFSSIETRYVLLRKELKETCGLYDVQPVFFGFQELISNNYAQPPAKIHIKKERIRLLQLLRTDLHNISEVDLQILYELCLNVATKYSITPEEQELMIWAGRKVVDMQREEILKLFE